MSLQDFLLQRLKATNPSGYKAFMEIRQSGRDPNDVLAEMYSKGEITDSQLDTIAKQMKLFGVKIDSREMEKIKSAKKSKSNTPYDFGGLF